MTGDNGNPRIKAQPKAAPMPASVASEGSSANAGPGGGAAHAGPENAPEPRTADKRIFTTGEAAEICKVSQQTIIRCFDSGRLGGFRVPGSKFRRIPRADLIKFMRDNDIPTEVMEAKATKRVLVVDDDPQILEVFQDLIGKDARFELKVCGNGYDAGMLTESFRPHVIVLDYMLPDINGNIVCQRIRERDELAGTKIMFVSGVVAQDEIDKLLKAGADDFVRKPFDIGKLMSKIEQMTGV
jgi:excisionase family DNA binding protein